LNKVLELSGWWCKNRDATATFPAILDVSGTKKNSRSSSSESFDSKLGTP
jgi:hypothetical protein